MSSTHGCYTILHHATTCYNMLQHATAATQHINVNLCSLLLRMHTHKNMPCNIYSMFIILCATPCIKRDLKGRKADKKEESSLEKDVKNRMREKERKILGGSLEKVFIPSYWVKRQTARQTNKHSAINEAEVLGQVAEPDGMQSKVEMETSRVKFLGAWRSFCDLKAKTGIV